MAFSVGRYFRESASFGDESAPVFVVDATEPELSVVEVALVSGGVARGVFLRADLDAGIGGGPAGDAVLEREVKVRDGAFPVEEFVIREALSFGNGGGDGSVFDSPDGGIALPLIEGFSVEEADWGGGEGQGKKKGKEEFHESTRE